jgi:peptidoglycan/LPS O-acetylase OafA/YrhL
VKVFAGKSGDEGLSNADQLGKLLPSGDEAGTSPEDRPFRPDVQGLRAIAVLLVVLYHAGVPWVSGGYIGVDVFFVISGFVITGVLLRERSARGSTSLRRFYARRARRILPAATLVIIVTVLAAFHFLGPLIGHETAVDGQWAAIFLANIHFAASQTNYLASQQPPSALQNYWSLAVEEQFYLLYPAVFLVTASVFRRSSLRLRLAAVLVVIITASYAYSIVLTSSNAAYAFFSPLTRAWELALGGLIAIAGHKLRRMPQAWAALVSWVGLAAIVLAGVTLTSATVYPGSLVAIPVVGAALVIAAGAAEPAWGVERLLRQRPVQVLGLLSYSLYLWHWPILVIAAEYRGTTSLPVWDNVLLLLVAVVAAAVTYRWLENPVRHARSLVGRPVVSVALGLCLVGATLAVTTVEERRPTVNLGSLATATTGSGCTPSPSLVSHLRSTYSSRHPDSLKPFGVANQSVVVIGDSTSCTLLPGLAAVGPTYGMQFHSGAVIGCGIVSGQLAPVYEGQENLSAYTAKCQAEADHDEYSAIERYDPRIVLWGSTDERSSLAVQGGQVLVSGSPQWHAVMMKRINERVESLLATGAKVILVLEPASVHQSPGIDSNDIEYERMNAMLREVAAQHPDEVGLVNLQPRVCPAGPPCPYVVPGFNPPLSQARQTFACGPVKSPVPCDETLRPLDGLHYTATASLWVAEWLVPRISAEAKELLSHR